MEDLGQLGSTGTLGLTNEDARRRASLGAGREEPLNSSFNYEKDLEVHEGRLSAKNNTSFIEYWKFMEAFMDLYTMEGQKRLEEHLRCRTTRVLEENAKQVEDSFDKKEEEDAAAAKITATGVDSFLDSLFPALEAVQLNCSGSP